MSLFSAFSTFLFPANFSPTHIVKKSLNISLPNFYRIEIECGADAQPISRARKTSIKKTIIYRLLVDPAALLITYALTGELSGSIIAVLLIETFSTAFYYILDRLM